MYKNGLVPRADLSPFELFLHFFYYISSLTISFIGNSYGYGSTFFYLLLLFHCSGHSTVSVYSGISVAQF